MEASAANTLFAHDLLDENPVIVKRLYVTPGQNSNDFPSALELFEVAILQNATTFSKGIIKTRPGFTAIANDTGTSLRVPGLGKFFIEGGTKYLTRVNSNKWEYWIGSGSWTQITGFTPTSDLVTNFVVAGNRQFLLNGTDNVFSTGDGTTALDEGNTNVDPPKSRFGIYHQNCLLLAGNLTNRSYIWISSVLATQTFDRAVRVIKIADQSGDDLTAMVNLSLTTTPGYLAFKNRSTYFVDTSNGMADPGNASPTVGWTITEIDPVHGCVGPRAAVAVGSSTLKGDCAYLSQEGETYRLRELSRTVSDAIGTGGILSLPIENLLSDVNESKMSEAIVFYFNERIFLAFPSGSATYNDTLAVLDLKNSIPSQNIWKWSSWTGLNIGSISTYEENGIEYLYFGSANASAKVFRALNGTTDDAAAISFIYESRREDFDYAELYKSFQTLEVQFLATDSSTVLVEAQIDGGGYTTLTAIPDSSLSASGPNLPINLPFNLIAQGKLYKSYSLEDLGQGRDIQIRITHSSAGNTINLIGYTVTAFLEPLNLEVRSS